MGSEICSTCALPEELCVCEDVAKTEQSVEISVEDREYGKQMTIVEGIDPDSVDIENLASELKSNLACGGTIDDGEIQLQGDHRGRIEDELDERGFAVPA